MQRRGDPIGKLPSASFAEEEHPERKERTLPLDLFHAVTVHGNFLVAGPCKEQARHSDRAVSGEELKIVHLFLHHILCQQKLDDQRLSVFAQNGNGAPEGTAAQVSDLLRRLA